MRILLPTKLLVTALGSLLLTGPAFAEDAPHDPKKLAFFESKIRPMLVKHCYDCHSGDPAEASGNLLVDSAEGLLLGGDSGTSITPGKPDESVLIDALRYDGLEMPPEGKLPANVIADFEKWVSDGAVDPRRSEVTLPQRKGIDIAEGKKFWAFTPVEPTPPPELTPRPRSPIDAFVEATHRENGLTAVPLADRTTIARRLYFDLTGLPPTPQDLDRVVNDPSPNAIPALVDRLLASPQFGVHWGRHWLDVARYADSNGSDFNATFHDAWRYRDFVVRSMNEDKPFDQFVRQQVAGDLLPAESHAERAENLIATTYLMLGAKMLSERDKEKLRMDIVDEQINTVGQGLLAMTLGCARCHDHKFDPIPTADYYAFAGIFRSTRTIEGESQQYVSTWRKTVLPTDPEHVAAVEQHTRQLSALKKKLKAAEKALANAKKNQPTILTDPLFVDDAQAKFVGDWTKSTYTKGYLGVGYSHDDNKFKGKKSAILTVTPTESGRYDVQFAYNSGGSRASDVPIVITQGDAAHSVTLDQRKPPKIDGNFASLGQFEFVAGQPVDVAISNAGTTGYLIIDGVRLVRLNEDGQPILTAAETNSKTLQKRIDEATATVSSLKAEIAELEKTAPPPLPRVMAAGDAATIADTEIRIRGEHLNHGEVVPRGFLRVAMTDPVTLPKSSSGRLELANWIADPDNPLTSRVIVNRVWSHLLGEGIVRTVDNFGTLGERPTHPELLDHLAARFVAPAGETSDGFGWSIKSLIREIVLSETYQRSTTYDPTMWEQDPGNRFLWRANRRQLPAEAIRDAMLSLDGTLDLEPGQSPVSGFGVLVRQNNPDAKSTTAKPTSRRSLYLPVIRNELPPIFTAFDFADPDFVVGKRPVTNVPAQALYLMNSPFVMESAHRTAERIIGDRQFVDASLVHSVYRTVLSRQPSESEVDRALMFLTGSVTPQEVPTDRNRLGQFVQALFASTEFRMID